MKASDLIATLQLHMRTTGEDPEVMFLRPGDDEPYALAEDVEHDEFGLYLLPEN